MNQAALLDAIGKHMDLLEKLSLWALLLSVGIGWAGLQRKDITVLGMTFGRREAFAAAICVYLFANFTIVVIFLRLGDLLALVDSREFNQASTKLCTHTWIMNPFAYFGGSALSRTYSCEGFGLLIVLWWVCHASLATLMDGSETKLRSRVMLIFLLIGLAALLSVERVNLIVIARGLDSLPKNTYRSFFSTLIERTFSTFLGIAIGVRLFRITTNLRGRWPAISSQR